MNYTEFYLTKFAAAAATPPPATPAPATPAPAPAPVAKPEPGKPTESKSDGLSGKEIAGLTTLGAGTAGLGVMGLNSIGQAHLAQAGPGQMISRSGTTRSTATLLDVLGIFTARKVNSISNALVPGATNAATAAKKLAPGVIGGAVMSTSGQDYVERLGVSKVPAAMGANALGAVIATPGGWQRKAVAAAIGSGVGLTKELMGYGPYWQKNNPPVAPVAPREMYGPPYPTNEEFNRMRELTPTPTPTPTVPAGQSAKELERRLQNIPTGINPFGSNQTKD